MITGSFIEPGTGTTMELTKWYVVSDSGSAYTDQGFDCPQEAMLWALAYDNGYYTKADITIWDPTAPQNGFEEANCVMVARGLDLFCFWRCSDPVTLSECNE